MTRNAAYLILRMISSNRCCLSVEAIPIKFKTELDLECLRKLKSPWAKRRTSCETNSPKATVIKLRSSVVSVVELRTRRTNQVSIKFLPNEAKNALSYKFFFIYTFISLVRCIRLDWKRCSGGLSIRLSKQTDTVLDDPNSFRRT